MKKIKVFMQFPWKFCDSNYYKYLLDCPPNNVIYISKMKNPGNTINLSKLKINNYVKQNIKKIIRKLNPDMPNEHFTKAAEKYNLIHCAHCLSKNKKPWVADIEYAGQFWAAPLRQGVFPDKRKVRKLLSSLYCKKILAWTEWGKIEILKQFPELKNKVDVVTYALPRQKAKRINRKKIVLSFISRRFYFKGGLHAVEVMDRLTKKYENVEGLVVADTPEEVLKRYSGNKKIKFLGLQPYSRIMSEIFPKTDIFLYPSYTDTFGFLMVESLAFGVPVVTVDGQSRKEIVSDGETGYVIEANLPKSIPENILKKLNDKLINSLYKGTEKLILDENLRIKMGKECLKLFEPGGKFSVDTRDKKLEQIYREAVED